MNTMSNQKFKKHSNLVLKINMEVFTAGLFCFLVIFMTPAAESVRDPTIKKCGVQLARTISSVCRMRLTKLLSRKPSHGKKLILKIKII